MARFEREQSEYIEKLVYLNRVSKTVKGQFIITYNFQIHISMIFF